MSQRSEGRATSPAPKAREVVIDHDAVNEQIVIAAAIVDPDARRGLLHRIAADRFFAKEHVAIWQALAELERRKLSYDHATIQKLSGGSVPMEYLVGLVDARPESPPNIDFHVGALLWDNARLTAVEGPIAGLLEALRDPRSASDRVRSLARQVALAFDGYEERKYLLDGEQLVRDQIAEIRKRAEGQSLFPFGIFALDKYEKDHEEKAGHPRLVPGAAPGDITIVTGQTGAGKTTFTANLVLGLARQRKKVLYGAWEVKGGMTLEILATISLGWSRTWMLAGRRADPGAPLGEDGMPERMDEEHIAAFAERMNAIRPFVGFLENPFQRSLGEKKRSNAANLDLLHGYIADSAADVFVGDLWERCLVYTDPDDEKHALYRQKAMAEETNCHCILLQQQRKDVELRADKRPTGEGIKGSGAWRDVASLVLGVHRPALWKAIDDDVLEVDVLKQRYGRWPLAVEFDWDGERGKISGGRTVPYDMPTESSDDAFGGDFKQAKGRGKGRGRR